MKEKHENNQFYNLIAIGSFDGIHSYFLNILESQAKTRIYLTENDSENILLSNNEKRIVLNSYGITDVVDYESNKCMAFIKQASSNAGIKLLKLLFDNKELSEEFGNISLKTSSLYDEEIARQSENIKNILLEGGEVEKAASLLGYYYFINGSVVSGNRLGRKLGFPTANTEPGNLNKVIPAKGVYAAMVNINNSWYKAMLNIGVRPTLNLEKLTIEAHLINYNGDLYNQNLSIHFISRIRDEMKFANTNELSKQLETDKNTVMSKLNNLRVDITANGLFCKYKTDKPA